jgi:internalin A
LSGTLCSGIGGTSCSGTGGTITPESVAHFEPVYPGLSKEIYLSEIIRQKNEKKNIIISVYKNARNTYQEFKIEKEKLRDKVNENTIINYLESNEVEVFFKAFSMKDYFDKSILARYNITQKELSSTNWFRFKIKKIFQLD